jgi:isopenicillin N synthase-like dioxygenase
VSTIESAKAVGVPVIDLDDPAHSDEIVAEIGAACERVGFIVITGHGVPAELIGRMHRVSSEFFALPAEEKLRSVSPTGNLYRGYAPQDSPGRTDLVEGYEIGRYDTAAAVAAAGYGPEWAANYDPNVWPERPEAFHSTWREYYAAMEELAGRLMNIFEAALTLPKGWFADKFDRHTSYLSANCYPPQPVPPPPGRVRRGEHTDIGSLTILYQDGVGGLQVFDRSGVWCDVPPIEGSYVINLGDMLAKWTNDRWVATEHRVVNPPAEKAAVERISIPFFQHPNFDALIECIPSCTSPENPPKYPAVLAGDWSKFRMSLSTP